MSNATRLINTGKLRAIAVGFMVPGSSTGGTVKDKVVLGMSPDPEFNRV